MALAATIFCWIAAVIMMGLFASVADTSISKASDHTVTNMALLACASALFIIAARLG